MFSFYSLVKVSSKEPERTKGPKVQKFYCISWTPEKATLLIPRYDVFPSAIFAYTPRDRGPLGHINIVCISV